MKLEDKFNFFVPATLSKATNEQGEEEMWVQGVASDPEKDLEGEELDPSGYDLSYFLKSGWLKWEHGKDPSQFIGEPTEANVTPANELFIKGKLYNASQTAREVYNLAEALEKSKSNRHLGWSIEGKATQRNKDNPKKVEKAVITNVVLTANPIGKNTYAEIVKGTYKEAYIEPEHTQEITCDGDQCVLDVIVGNEQFILKPDFSIIQKSLDRDCQEKLEKAIDDDSLHTITIKARDPDGTLVDIINHIKARGNIGHYLEVVVDADMTEEEGKKKFGWDGDGSDYIKSVEVEAPIKKSMEAGHATGTETTNKLDVSGASLKVEDVEGKEKKITYSAFEDDCDDPNILRKDKECVKKAILILATAIEKGLIKGEIVAEIQKKINIF